jgi:adenosine 3'-phospho 5'-phosphosulfate transporter B2
MFTLSERSGSTGHEDSFFGVSLLVMYLACDSFTSQWQSKIFKTHSIDQYEMMLGNNIWALFMTGIIY